MRAKAITALFLIAGLINFVPLAGVVGKGMVEAAYAVEVASAGMELLLRHRAVLFGIIGGLLLVAAFRPSLRPVEAICGFVSMISFALLYLLTGPESEALAGVLRFDLIGIAVLVAAVLLDRTSPTS